ncbi:MAG: VTT domain-containing protein [Chloroflexota bacterium]
MEELRALLDLKTIIPLVGYPGLFAIVFAESGLFFGFFLPGDSLLFTAGFFASQGYFNVWLLMGMLMVAAIGGDSVGYWFGEKFGRKLFQREDSLFFHKKHLVRAAEFYERHGGKAIVLARFIPIVRTFVPIVAGMAQMRYTRFVAYNVWGGILWVISMVGGGYFLVDVIRVPYRAMTGKDFGPEDIDRILLPIIVLIVVASVLPAVWHLYKEDPEAFKRTVGRLLGRAPKGTQPV